MTGFVQEDADRAERATARAPFTQLDRMAAFMAAADPTTAEVLALGAVVGRLAYGLGLPDETIAAAVLDGFHAPEYRPALTIPAGGPRLVPPGVAIP